MLQKGENMIFEILKWGMPEKKVWEPLDYFL